MADELEKQREFFKGRKAKLWRRCANMAEILAKEETEAALWQQRYKKAMMVAPGNMAFFWTAYIDVAKRHAQCRHSTTASFWNQDW